MVSAEFVHNPYLLETKVLFNGHSPQVNSAIRKYWHMPLVDWIDEVPRIFHDEMNGYDFDLFFTGTDADFERVRDSFVAAGVPEESVRVIRKGTIEEPVEKMEEILSLLEWLGENYSPRLELEPLLDGNPNLVDTTFSVLSIHDDGLESSHSRIALDCVDDVTQLEASDLTSTPILINIDPKNMQRVSQEVPLLLGRRDVVPGQLFFRIHRAMRTDRVARVLSDLGVDNPQVVASVDDPVIVSYVKGHLVTDYVREAIATLEREVSRVESELQLEGMKGEKTSAFKEAQIANIDDEVARLERLDDTLEDELDLEIPREFGQSQQLFRMGVSGWKSRKRRLEGDAEARIAASDFERTVSSLMSDFTRALTDTSNSIRDRIDDELAQAYESAGVDRNFRPNEAPVAFPTSPVVPSLRNTLLSLKEISLVEQRRDFFGFFGSTPSAGGDKVEVTTYLLDVWRTRVAEMLEPSLDQLSSSFSSALESHRRQEIEAYRSHIAELIAERKDRKGRMESLLSDDEKKLRAEGDWFSSLKQRLTEIERG